MNFSFIDTSFTTATTSNPKKSKTGFFRKDVCLIPLTPFFSKGELLLECKDIDFKIDLIKANRP
jgi:hypothetical protein